MRQVIPVLMWCSALLASLSATEAPDVLAGPWMTLLPDGGLRVSLSLSAEPSARWLAGLTISHGPEDDPLPGTWQRGDTPVGVLRRWIISRTVSAEHLADLSGSHIHLHGVQAREAVALRLPRRPRSGQAARVMVVPGRRYPGRSDITQMADHLGGPLQIVILLGAGDHHGIGSGGWEDKIAMVRIADPQGSDPAAWRQDLSWGDLGLPIITRSQEAALAIARDLNPIQVLLQAQATWRIGLSDAGIDDGNRLLLSACRRHHVPLVLAAGSGAGFLSEPLSLLTDGRIVDMPGGSRYALLGSGDDPPAAVTGQVARVAHGGLAAGLAVVEGRLQVVFHPLDGPQTQDVWTLRYAPWPEAIPAIRTDDRAMLRHGLQRWIERGLRTQQRGRVMVWRGLEDLGHRQEEGRRARELVEAVNTIGGLNRTQRERMLTGPWPWPDDGPQETPPQQQGYPWPVMGLEHGCGWGIGDVQALLTDLRDTDADNGAKAALTWLPHSALSEVLRGAAVLRDHIDLATDDPVLLARFAVISPLVVAEVLAGRDQVDPGLVREVVLRALADDDDQVLRPVADLIIRSHDHDLIRVIERRAAHGRDVDLLRILMWRLQAQAAGDVPLEQDPLLQHRVISTVFGSPYLSPTPLRRIALKLEDQVHPLAAESLQRFFERHGRQRP